MQETPATCPPSPQQLTSFASGADRGRRPRYPSPPSRCSHPSFEPDPSASRTGRARQRRGSNGRLRPTTANNGRSTEANAGRKAASAVRVRIMVWQRLELQVVFCTLFSRIYFRGRLLERVKMQRGSNVFLWREWSHRLLTADFVTNQVASGPMRALSRQRRLLAEPSKLDWVAP